MKCHKRGDPFESVVTKEWENNLKPGETGKFTYTGEYGFPRPGEWFKGRLVSNNAEYAHINITDRVYWILTPDTTED